MPDSSVSQAERSGSELKPWRVVLRLVGAREELADVDEEVKHLMHVAENGGFIVEYMSVEQMVDAEVIDGSPLDELLGEGN